ncbi:3'-5' exonuclease, partial [bacterium]|nr:3'-5' exonuclease [bacterium]
MYLFFDTETGGLQPNHSLLSVSAIAVDPQLQIVPVLNMYPGLHLRVKHENYVVTEQAMQINKIDLAVHDQIGLTVSETIEKLQMFFDEARVIMGVQRLIPAGHNVAFDMRFLQAQLFPEKQWDTFFKNPPLCTCAIARFFNAANRLTVGCGLEKLCTHFGIDAGDAHNAE